MQPDASNAKQQIVERVKQSTNIMVAVSANPSVDALSAAIGLALMLNKMDKHTTAVFSGAIPPAIEFLKPDKTFENNVDSLRDFIISLDKEKADRLRYKVEDDVVRIFITPYRTPITEKDLQFSQGDFNVELIIGLGVDKREDLDKAIIAHGRILHDATVITINSNGQQSSLGAIDWHEANLSGLSEMLVSLAEAFQQPGLLDEQIATALLTGIVAATDRFSNQLTSPRVMTLSAQLMAAGANQQLIANNLVKAHEMPSQADGKLVAGADSIKVTTPEPSKPKSDGELDIVHPKEPKQQPQGKKGNKGPQQSFKNAEDELAAALPAATVSSTAVDDLKAALSAPASQPKPQTRKMLRESDAPGSRAVNDMGGTEKPAQPEESYIASSGSWRGQRMDAPALGGTLNATTEEAMTDALRAEEDDRNRKILTHPVADMSKPAVKTNKTEVKPAPVSVPPPEPVPEPVQQSAPAQVPAPEPEPTVLTPEPIPTPLPEPPLPPPAEPVSGGSAGSPSLTEPPAAAEPPALPVLPEQPAPEPELPPVPPAPPAMPAPDLSLPEPPATPAVEPAAPADLDAARQAVDAALASQPFDPAHQPLQAAGATSLGSSINQLPEPPSTLPDDAPTLIPAPGAPAVEAPAPPASLPPLPPMPPLPQHDPNQPLPPPPSLDNLPPLPSTIPPAPIVEPPTTPPGTPSTAPNDPRQFKIPGA